ncbi:KdsC family phosphatase [Ottowia pentelensis]|uniref:KdsC family phosphatase n=1 Tax=Ottowia pentelensis TaxID=511108 RepID=A0ABV6PVY5_9BURK|nr:HAD hydrolase family protein [Ottowia sp.]
MQVAQTWPAELLLRAQGIRLLLLDVDGVLTDGGLYYGEGGEVLKRFHTLDGHGLKLLGRAGIAVGVISGRDSPALRQRLAALGIQHARLGTEDKLPAAQALLQELGIDWPQTAAMGDDWPDLPLLRHAGLACAPANAHAEARALAAHVTALAGGAGAVRELCDLLLAAGGHYRRLLDQHLGPA